MTDEYLKGIQAKTDATTNPTPPTGKAMTAEQCVSALRAFDVGDPSTWPEAAVIEAALAHIDAQAAEIAALRTLVAEGLRVSHEKVEQVRNAARESLATWMISNSFATGHGDTTGDLLVELSGQVAALKAELATARTSALEEAAKVCERRAADRFDEFGTTEWDTNASYYQGSRAEMFDSLDEEDDACAKAIRALKGQTP